MRVPGRKFLQRALRPLARTLAPGAVVLGYHRIADDAWDPLGLAVSPRHFAAQIEALGRCREIVSLGTLAGMHAAGEPLERHAAVTFDDGYADFATNVLPVLEARSVPATVFVATGFTGRAFWWDEVAALLEPRDGAAGSLEIVRRDGAAWHFRDLDRDDRRAGAARELCDRLACAGAAEIDEVVEQLRASPASSGSVPAFGAMNRSVLETVAQHPLVELGAHTVSHGCLARLAPADQQAEIDRSKSAIESLPGMTATVFSYPNGSYSAATPSLVRSLGFACACTSREGTFNRRTDPYRVPRIWTPNVGAAEFRGWLGQWVAGLH